MTYEQIIQMYQLGIFDREQAVVYLKHIGVLAEPGARELSQPKYKRQSGVLTQIVADLKADGQSKNTVLGFFVSVVEAKYDG